MKATAPLLMLGLISVVALGACGKATPSGSASPAGSPSTSPPAPTPPASPAAPLVACDIFNLQTLNTSTNLTWTVTDASKASACTITASNGSAIAISTSPTGGGTAEVLRGAESACDAGTVVTQAVANGGYDCLIKGTPSGGAVFAGSSTLVAMSGISLNGADTTQVRGALVGLLKSFVAQPGDTPSPAATP